MSKSSLIFCAIDTPDLERAIALSRQIAPVSGAIKLGLEFFNSFGPQGVARVLEVCPEEAQLFLDLKFHDIPNTVAGAVRTICRRFSPAYLNVHAAGGSAMMAAAKAARDEESAGRTKLLAVTVLTSLSEEDLCKVGYQPGMSERAVQMARLAQDAGLDGVVCSSHEIEALRAACGPDFELMVPGIRPVGAAAGDQKRVMSPAEALGLGATHLVIGRPITAADDPAAAAQAILDGIKRDV